MTGNLGEYEYLWAVLLPARYCIDPGYATIVKLTDGIGPLKPAYGIWQEEQAWFLKGDMFSSKFNSPPSIRTASYPVPCSTGGLPDRVGGVNACHSAK